MISITEAGRDTAENGRELHSDSKVCVWIIFSLCVDTSLCGRKAKNIGWILESK